MGDGASVSGELSAEPGCVYIETAEGVTVLPVFPHDVVEWDGTTLRLREREFRSGDMITVGGGFRTPSVIESDEVVLHMPDDCRTNVEVFAVS